MAGSAASSPHDGGRAAGQTFPTGTNSTPCHRSNEKK
jgi:hypothetical protein